MPCLYSCSLLGAPGMVPGTQKSYRWMNKWINEQMIISVHFFSLPWCFGKATLCFFFLVCFSWSGKFHMLIYSFIQSVLMCQAPKSKFCAPVFCHTVCVVPGTPRRMFYRQTSCRSTPDCDQQVQQRMSHKHSEPLLYTHTVMVLSSKWVSLWRRWTQTLWSVKKMLIRTSASCVRVPFPIPTSCSCTS